MCSGGGWVGGRVRGQRQGDLGGIYGRRRGVGGGRGRAVIVGECCGVIGENGVREGGAVWVCGSDWWGGDGKGNVRCRGCGCVRVQCGRGGRGGKGV